MEYPDNGGYAVAGYVVTAIIVFLYAGWLFARLRRTR